MFRWGSDASRSSAYSAAPAAPHADRKSPSVLRAVAEVGPGRGRVRLVEVDIDVQRRVLERGAGGRGGIIPARVSSFAVRVERPRDVLEENIRPRDARGAFLDGLDAPRLGSGLGRSGSTLRSRSRSVRGFVLAVGVMASSTRAGPVGLGACAVVARRSRAGGPRGASRGATAVGVVGSVFAAGGMVRRAHGAPEPLPGRWGSLGGRHRLGPRRVARATRKSRVSRKTNARRRPRSSRGKGWRGRFAQVAMGDGIRGDEGSIGRLGWAWRVVNSAAPFEGQGTLHDFCDIRYKASSADDERRIARFDRRSRASRSGQVLVRFGGGIIPSRAPPSARPFPDITTTKGSMALASATRAPALTRLPSFASANRARLAARPSRVPRAGGGGSFRVIEYGDGTTPEDRGRASERGGRSTTAAIDSTVTTVAAAADAAVAAPDAPPRVAVAVGATTSRDDDATTTTCTTDPGVEGTRQKGRDGRGSELEARLRRRPRPRRLGRQHPRRRRWTRRLRRRDERFPDANDGGVRWRSRRRVRRQARRCSRRLRARRPRPR